MSKNLESSIQRAIDSLQECIDGLQDGGGEKKGHSVYWQTYHGRNNLRKVRAIKFFNHANGINNADECLGFLGYGSLINDYYIGFTDHGYSEKRVYPGDYIVAVGPLTLVLNEGEFGFLFEAADA